MDTANYELRANGDGSYCLTIRGAIRFDGLSFSDAVARICEAENGVSTRNNKEDKNNV